MNAKYLFAVGALTLALAACGGGGTSGGSAPALPLPLLPAATPTPTPTPTPTGPPHPSAAGDTFTFNGTLTRSDTYTYPAPSPLPSTALSAAVTQSVSVAATTNPFGTGTVQDFKVRESDAYSAQTLTSTSDFYYQNGTAFSLLGYSSVDDVGNKSTVAYVAAQTLDQLPEVSGSSWTNNPASSLTQAFIDGEAASRTVASNGTYTDTEQIYGSGTNYPAVKAILTENADGSGEFQIVRYENGRTGFQSNETVYDNYFISPPSAQSANAQFLTVTSQVNDAYYGAPSPPAPAPFAAMPVWYSVPLSLYSETDQDLGSVPIPSTCSAPAAFGSKATEIQQALTLSDTVLGTITTTTTSSYIVNGFGPVCVALSSTVKTFFNYSMDTTIKPIFYQNQPGPLQTTTIAQTLTLASQGPYAQNSRRAANSRNANAAPISSAEIAIARLQLTHAREGDRTKRIRSVGTMLMKIDDAKGLLK